MRITIERETLLPCPFCGAKAEILTIPEDRPDAGAMFVQCCDSRCMTSSALLYPLMDDVRALLVERWNRRAALAANADIGLPMADLMKLVLAIEAAMAAKQTGENDGM